MAHDPFLQRGYARFVDWPSHRYRRILVPLLAHVTAVSRPWIPFAYATWMLVFLFVGVQLSGSVGRGLVFAALPSTWISLDRMVLDMPCLAFLVVALWLWATGRRYWAALPLMLMCLTRETGLVLTLAFILAALADRRQWRLAAVLSSSVIPTLLWSYWLGLRFDAFLQNWMHLSLNSFGVFFNRFAGYSAAGLLEQVLLPLDTVAFIGFLVVLVWGLQQYRRRDPLGLAAFFQSLLCLYLICVEDWTHVYDHGRLSAAILLAMGYEAVDRRNWMLLLPVATLSMRVAIQISPQIYRFQL
jgi:hypothetical protein